MYAYACLGKALCSSSPRHKLTCSGGRLRAVQPPAHSPGAGSLSWHSDPDKCGRGGFQVETKNLLRLCLADART